MRVGNQSSWSWSIPAFSTKRPFAWPGPVPGKSVPAAAWEDKFAAGGGPVRDVLGGVRLEEESEFGAVFEGDRSWGGLLAVAES